MENEATSDDIWLRNWHIAPLWRVRSKHVRAVAAAHGVRCKERETVSTSESSYTVYHLGDARRLAEDLDNGTVVLDPRWRTDTPQGHRAVARDVLIGCGLLVLLLAVIFTALART